MSLPGVHPILTGGAAKAWEAGLLRDESAEWGAMLQAGAALATAISEDFKEIGGLPQEPRILVLAGKGHNGGDALLATRALLQDRPRAQATVVLVFGQDELRPLARRSLEWLFRDVPDRVTLLSPESALATGSVYTLCLDGIFGFQFRAPMDAATAALIARVNDQEEIRLRAAVDLPSGVGEVNAATIFRADFTYATGIVKKPVLAPGVAGAVGRLRYLDLGFFGRETAQASFKDHGAAGSTQDHVLTRDTLAQLAGLRASQTDKRTYGHLFVVGGSHSYPGAVVLGVRAALRSGVGLVTAFVPARLAPEYAARHPEAMWVGCPETNAGGLAMGTVDQIGERMARASALLMGPGMSAGREVVDTMAAIVRQTQLPLVLDADALRPEVMKLVRERPIIGTPHGGELQRIAPALFTDGRLNVPKGVLVLKGPLTRVTDGRENYFSPFGGPVLARGGSGDILAGLIGGLLAQKPDDLLLAACRGVVWHGRAADLLARARGQVAIEISEILEQLGPALLP